MRSECLATAARIRSVSDQSNKIPGDEEGRLGGESQEWSCGRDHTSIRPRFSKISRLRRRTAGGKPEGALFPGVESQQDGSDYFLQPSPPSAAVQAANLIHIISLPETATLSREREKNAAQISI